MGEGQSRMWRRHIAMAFAVTLLGVAPVLAADSVRWIKATKKALKGAYLMPGKGGVHICAKRGDPGTLVMERGRICTYINSENGIPKWTNHYHVLGLAGDAEPSWRRSDRLGPKERAALVKTPSGQHFCRVRSDGRWIIGRLIAKDFSCLYSAKEQRNIARRGKHEVLLVTGGTGTGRQAEVSAPRDKQAPLPTAEKSRPAAAASAAATSGMPVRWFKAKKEIPVGAYLLGKSSGADEPSYICRVRHPRWGWFVGTLSGAGAEPHCDVAVGGRRTRHDAYQVLGVNRGFQLSWQKRRGGELPVGAIIASPQDAPRNHVCRVKVDSGVYVIGNLEGKECTIPYTAHQANPVPVEDKYEVLVWRGGNIGPLPASGPSGLTPVKWVASLDDVPPDAFLDQRQGAHYICRVGDDERGWQIGTMNKLRDVRQVDGKSIPLARTCYVAQGGKIRHYPKYDVLVFRSGFSGRWQPRSGALPAMAVRATPIDADPVYICGGVRKADLLSGGLKDRTCLLPAKSGPRRLTEGYRVLVAVKGDITEGRNGGSFDGEYRCVAANGNLKRVIFLLITAKGSKSAGGPFKVVMQHGPAEKKKFDLTASGQSGIGLYYPNTFGFGSRQMVVAHGAQAIGEGKKLDIFVAMMNLSDLSGDGAQLRMTTLSSELVPSADGGYGAALSAAKPGEGRAWRCQRTRKF